MLDRDAEWALLASRPVTDITGIAGRRAARLAPHGIASCLDLALADRRLVRKLLTRSGEALWYELHGEQVVPIHTRRPPHKMLGRGGSIGQPTADPHRVWAWTVRSLERLIEELEYHQVRPGRLSVWINYRDGGSGASDAVLLTPSNRFDLLVEAARRGLRSVWRPGALVSRLHLIATDLRLPGEIQMGLFEPPAAQASAVANLKRQVNARHGRFALRSGATLYLPDLYRDAAASYDICDVRGKICF